MQYAYSSPPQAEVEMRRRVELIQQIRAMECVPVIRTKFVDLTETAGQGLLSEMSIAEVTTTSALEHSHKAGSIDHAT